MKKIRLPLDIYSEENRPCAITICAKDGRDIFLSVDFVNEVSLLLINESQTHKMLLYAFCIMPNHIHIIIAASENISIIDWIQRIKGKITKISWKYGFQGSVLQKRFYDHFIRSDEDLLKHCKYVWENPLRKELSSERRKPPYTGSAVYDITKIAGG
ncbi:MAG: transposase [FCB group bacterium]|nr:transposase [FCB group bacterium]